MCVSSIINKKNNRELVEKRESGLTVHVSTIIND